MQLSGHYFLPGSARETGAVLRTAADGLSLEVHANSGEQLAVAPLRRIIVTSRLGGVRRKLEFPGGAVFETTDNDAVDILFDGRGGALYRLEKSWRLALISLTAIGVACAWFALYGVPAGADWLAQRTPPSISRLAADQTMAILDKRILLPTTLSRARQQDVVDRFQKVAGWEKGGEFRLLLRDAPKIGANAFALPDGRIVVTDQLVSLVTNDDELDGVLAHELAHVNRAHGLQSVYQASLVPAAIAFITGDASQIGHIASILPGLLLESSYSRTFEQQADDDAAILLRRHGEDPGHLADLLERLDRKNCSKNGCGPSWLGSHPTTSVRAARLRRALAS